LQPGDLGRRQTVEVDLGALVLHLDVDRRFGPGRQRLEKLADGRHGALVTGDDPWTIINVEGQPTAGACHQIPVKTRRVALPSVLATE
jgi:hypothetical protein